MKTLIPEVLKRGTGDWTEVELRVIDYLLCGLDEDDIREILPESDQYDFQALFSDYEEESDYVDEQIRELMGERPPARHVRRSLRKMKV